MSDLKAGICRGGWSLNCRRGKQRSYKNSSQASDTVNFKVTSGRASRKGIHVVLDRVSTVTH